MNNILKIEMNGDSLVFRPHQQISGRATWQLSSQEKSLELLLFWQTSGKGDTDTGIIESIIFENPELSGSREFSFILPYGPYSFSGKLIAINWFLELAIYGKYDAVREKIILSPTGSEIVHTGYFASTEKAGRKSMMEYIDLLFRQKP